MNAKKIMGAVLVALLAAALFIGAASAADNVDIGPVTTYTALSGSPVTGFTWAAAQTFIADDGSSVTTVNNGGFYFPYDGDALNKKYSGIRTQFLSLSLLLHLHQRRVLLRAVRQGLRP